MVKGKVADRKAVLELCILHIKTSETMSEKEYLGTAKGCLVAEQNDQADAELSLETLPQVRARSNERLD